jgi:hypothetical protein
MNDSPLPSPPIRPGAQQALSGSEHFSNGDAVLNFWRWAMGDLRMNNARGYLAEYLIARAVNAQANRPRGVGGLGRQGAGRHSH